MEKPQADRDDKGQSIITKPYLKKLCQYQELFETPRLNSHLYLHYMGFIDIRNLEDYTGLRALWLESNLIREIKGLDQLTKLRCLYLQNNGISKIENLECLKELASLNLSHNCISLIENLEELKNLEDFDISYNKIAFSYSLKGLKDMKMVKALDLRNNIISDSEFLLETLLAMPELRCLYLRGNLCVKNIPNYRKNLVAQLKNLNYLDEKVVSEIERLASEAWLVSGKDAEMEVRRKYFEEKEAQNRKSLYEYGDIERQAIEKRKMIKLQLEEQRDEQRKGFAEARRKLLQGQNAKLEEMLAEISLKEQELDNPIDEDSLIPLCLKPGTVTFRSGDFDHYGNKIEVVQDTKPKNALLDLNKFPIADLENLLVSCEFDFFRVWDFISGEYNCTPDSIRLTWFDYTSKLEELNELE